MTAISNSMTDLPSSFAKGPWACIAGGSSGFGLILAQRLFLQGINVAIIGRDRKKLADAMHLLQSNSSATNDKNFKPKSVTTTPNNSSSQQIITFAVDLIRPNESENEIIHFRRWLSEIDLAIAIAAVGKSDRGFIDQLDSDDLVSSFQTNVITAFHFGNECFPSLQRGGGTLVHIASLAGIIAAPGMGAYSIAKHGVVALSRQLRVEWKPKGVKVMLVCPGPIANDSNAGRYDAIVEERQLDGKFKMPAGGANLKLIDPIWLADEIYGRAGSNQREWIVPWKVKWLAALASIVPSLVDRILKKK